MGCFASKCKVWYCIRSTTFSFSDWCEYHRCQAYCMGNGQICGLRRMVHSQFCQRHVSLRFNDLVHDPFLFAGADTDDEVLHRIDYPISLYDARRRLLPI